MSTPSRTRTAIGVAVVVAAAVNAAGYAFDLYDRLWWFDEALHVYTPLVLTLLAGLFLHGRVLTGRTSHPLLLAATIASVGLAMATVWEVAEWAFDLVRAGDVIKGEVDTITDLVLGAAGSTVAALLCLRIFAARGRTYGPRV